MTAHKLLVAGSALLACSILTSTCSAPKPATPAPAVQQLWGDMKPVVSVKELMRDMIDPASDYIFDSVSTVETKAGVVEHMPTTDADWNKIRAGAVMIAEGVYLLKVPRPFTPPGEDNNSTGEDASELSAAQIKAKLEHDPVLWNAKIEALRNVGLQVLDIVKRRDAKEMWDAAENLDEACETCHLEYWYPGQKTLMPKLDKRLQDLFGAPGLKPGRSGASAAEPPGKK